jgi:hypothetical protein
MQANVSQYLLLEEMWPFVDPWKREEKLSDQVGQTLFHNAAVASASAVTSFEVFGMILVTTLQTGKRFAAADGPFDAVSFDYCFLSKNADAVVDATLVVGGVPCDDCS